MNVSQLLGLQQNGRSLLLKLGMYPVLLNISYLAYSGNVKNSSLHVAL